jgi:hypothetical protein
MQKNTIKKILDEEENRKSEWSARN